MKESRQDAAPTPDEVHEVFGEALRLPTSARDAFLRARCAGQSALRREVESLLGWDLVEASPLTGLAVRRSEALLPAGHTLGPYVVETGVGRGGMGAVYRGRHSVTGAVVALKTVVVPTPSSLAGIRREVHALSRLRHPGIVRILDEGEAAGTPWYAMELHDGTPFRDHVAELAQLGPRALLDPFRRVCEALSYLHGEGVVHGDLKPENLVVAAGQPIIVDFGLWCSWAGSVGRESLDGHALAGGTRGYMAPEQLAGRLPDARADLYALGRMLGDALAGLAVEPRLSQLLAQLLAEDPRARIGHAAAVAHRLAEIGGDPPSTRPARAYVYRPRLLGRDEPMGALRSAWAGPTGSINWIVGPSGVGKTRLLAELMLSARPAGLEVISCACSRDAAGPLHAWRGALRVLAAHLVAGAVRPSLRAGAATLGAYEPTIPRGDDAAAAPPDSPRRILGALESTLTALAEDGPLLVLLDDLQWADDLSLAVLAHIVDRRLAARVPVHVVGAARSEELTESLSALLHRPDTRCERLMGLAPGEARQMVDEMLAWEVPDALAGSLVRQAEGNPFFIAEYLRTAIALGWLQLDTRGLWRPGAAGASGELPLPGGMRTLIQRRLELLDPSVLAVARQASILGREDDTSLLARVAGGTIDAELHELARREVLELDGARYRFLHDQIREVVEGEVPDGMSREIHRRVARVIDGLGVVERDPRLEALGRHFSSAGDPARARGAHLEAARVAQSRHAQGVAMRNYEAYLAHVETPTPESVDVQNQRGRIAYFASESRPFHAAALRDARRIGYVPGETMALTNLAFNHGRAGRPAIARSMLARVLRTCEHSGDRPGAARALNALATVEHHQCRFAAAQETYERALVLHRELGNRESAARQLRNLANVAWHLGQLTRSADLHEQALTIALEIEDPAAELEALAGMGAVHRVMGRRVEARAAFRRALILARRVDATFYEANMLAHLAVTALDEGALAAGADGLHQALAILRAQGDAHMESYVLGDLGRVELMSGHPAAAAARYREALRLGREVSTRLPQTIALAGLAAVARQRGRLRSSATLLDAARRMAEEIGDRIALCECALEGAHLEVAARRDPAPAMDRAAALIDELGIGPEGPMRRQLDTLRAARAVTAPA